MADYTPTLGEYTELKPFRFWCQKVLPLVYDDSLSYYELLCKVVDYLNKTMEDVDTMHDDVVNLHAAYVQLQTYVNTYFDNLDVQEEINNKLDEMATSGALVTILQPTISDEVGDWLTDHIGPTTPAIDNTLSVSGAGADAKVTGDTFKKCILYRGVITTGTDLTDNTLQAGAYVFLHDNVLNSPLATGLYGIYIKYYDIGTSRLFYVIDTYSGVGYNYVNASWVRVANYDEVSKFMYYGTVPNSTDLTNNSLAFGYYSFAHNNVTNSPLASGDYGIYIKFYKNGSKLEHVTNVSNGKTYINVSGTTWMEIPFINETITYKGTLSANTNLTVNTLPLGVYAFAHNNVTNSPLSSGDYGFYIIFRNSDTSKLHVAINTYSAETFINVNGNTWVKIAKDSDVSHFFYHGSVAASTNLLNNDLVEGIYAFASSSVVNSPLAGGEYGIYVKYYGSTSSNSRLSMAINSYNGDLYIGVGTTEWIKVPTDRVSLTYKGSLTSVDLTGTSIGTGIYVFGHDNVTNSPLYSGAYGFYISYHNGSSSKLHMVIDSFSGAIFTNVDGTTWVRNGDFNPLQHKKIAVIGDSITEHNNRASVNWVNLMTTNDFAQITNLGKGGTGFIAEGSHERYIDRISQIPEGTEMIGVSGSFNDLGQNYPIGTASDTGSTTFGGFINAFFDALSTAFPATPVCCYVLNAWSEARPGVTEKAEQYVALIKEICHNRCIPFEALWDKCNLRPWVTGNQAAYFTPEASGVTGDQTHPNSAGHKLLYAELVELFKKTVYKN